jgi:hypothetical protein
MNDNFVILPEYKLAIESLKKNPVTVIFGNAGSGKSTFINYIKNKIRNTLLLAPTGIAALNIGGKTIHSVCKLPPYYINKSDIKRLPNVQRQFLCNLNLIIIDEISMVSSNLLDALDDFLRMNRGIFKPFGGVHILLVGDLFQLPPIVDNKYDFKKYKSELFFDSMVIQSLIQKKELDVIKFDNVMRQKDEIFIKVLNNIRIGKNIENTINVLNKVTNKSKNIPQDYIQITPYNDISDITNKRKLDEINLPIKTYFGKVSGKFNTNNCIVPQTLSLKVGAQVMICKNNKKLGLVNGQIGKVLALNDESVKVDFGNGKIENITSELWEEFSLPNKDGKTKVSGSFVQIPLKLAWSITIHKSQSATIEKLYIDMDRGAFAPGMLYVALSRAKSLKGLILSKDILMEDVIVDQRCIDFFQSF